MEKYITQLLEMLQEAQHNRPTPHYLELPEEMEALRGVMEMEKPLDEDEQTMESIFGVPQHYFPPEDRLTDEQIGHLTNGILELWRVFHYEADFRKGEFNQRQQYTKLVAQWKEHVSVFQGTNGTWHIEMFDYDQYWDEDEMRYLSDNEFDAKHSIKNPENRNLDK